MICTAIPVVNPVITAVDTNCMTDPSRSSPSASMTTPTSSVSVAIAPGSCGSSPAPASTLADESAMALVSVVTMRTVRANADPTIVDTTPEYSPTTGLNPPMFAYAMPSGMENSPVTRPDETSLPVGRPQPPRHRAGSCGSDSESVAPTTAGVFAIRRSSDASTCDASSSGRLPGRGPPRPSGRPAGRPRTRAAAR